MRYQFTLEEDSALKLDSEDPLSKYRSHFYIPKNSIYFDGNSLGLLSKEAENNLLRVLTEWKTHGIQGWFETEKPWFHYGERLGALAAPLVGAEPDEVVTTGTTTINLHSLVSSFYKPQGKKTKILADELDFPTDIYALKSQIKLKNLDPEEHLVLIPSSDGRTLETDTIIDYMDQEQIALILLPSALYRSGQLLDMKYITKEAKRREIMIGWDCSHSVGAVPHYFDELGVDFAFWCSYKYLNSGPGGTAFLYINKKHFSSVRISGSLDYHKGQPLFTFIGRMTYQKGVDKLVGALETLLPMDKEFQVLILGSGSKEIEDDLIGLTRLKENKGRICILRGYDQQLDHARMATRP